MISALLRRMGLVLVVLMLATPSWAGVPAVYCELSALAPQDALERLAESYRGLLEFGGEGFRPETASLEKLFAFSPGRDQRSVALNESLARLGDWVLFEAREHGLTHERILERLREVVSAHLEASQRERADTQEIRQERQRGFHGTVFSPMTTQGPEHSSVLLGDGQWIASGGAKESARIRHLNDLSHFSEVPWPDPESMGTINPSWRRASVPHRLGGTDEVLIQYLNASVFEVWNWRTMERVHRWDVGVPTSTASVSPSLRFVLAMTAVSSKYVLLDLRTGYSQRFEHDGGLGRFVWSRDGRHFAWVGRESNKTQAQIYRVLESPSEGTLAQPTVSATFDRYLVKEYSRPYLLDGGRDILFFSNDRISSYHLKGPDHEVENWSVIPLEHGTYFADEWVQGAGLAESEFAFRRKTRNLKRLEWVFMSLRSGRITRIVALPEELHEVHSSFSPSGRYWMVRHDRSNEVVIWDMVTRQPLHQFHSAFTRARDPRFSEDESTMIIESVDGAVQVFRIQELGND